MKRLLSTYGVLVAFLVLLVVNIVWQPDVFLKPQFLLTIINQNAAVGILAVGMTLVVIGGGIDLSVGSMMAITASLGVLAMNKVMGNSMSPVTSASLAVMVSVVIGTVFGLINGLVITLGRVAPFISTLAGLVAYRSMALAIADGGEIRASTNDPFSGFGSSGISLGSLTVSYQIAVFILCAIFAGVLLNKTRYGRYLIAVGANEKAAIYSAINTNRVKVITYSLMGSFAGLAAIGAAARMNSVSTSQIGLYYELDAIAAVVIGGTSLSGGRGRIWTTVIGVLLLGLITNMLITLGVSAYWQGAVKGVIILLAVLIQRGETE